MLRGIARFVRKLFKCKNKLSQARTEISFGKEGAAMALIEKQKSIS